MWMRSTTPHPNPPNPNQPTTHHPPTPTKTNPQTTPPPTHTNKPKTPPFFPLKSANFINILSVSKNRVISECSPKLFSHSNCHL